MTGRGDKKDAVREQRPQAQQDDAFRCTPEEYELIANMAAWSGMNRQDYIIAKLTDTQVEVRPSVSVQKALKDSMAELAKEVRLAASYSELSESLQQRVEHVMRFFLALGEPIDSRVDDASQEESFPAMATEVETNDNADNASIFGMGRG